MKKQLYLFLFLVPLVTMAQNIDRSKAPSPGKAPLIQVGDPVKFTLANGLQVFVVKNTKLPQVSATLALDYDGFEEGDKAGVAQMAGQLLKRGTTTKSKAQLDEAIEFLGGSMSTSSQSASVSSLKGNFPSLLGLLSEVVLQPALSSEELEKIRKQTLSGIESNKDDADAISGNVVKKLVYGATHPYGEIATTKTVNQVSIADVKSFLNTYWLPNAAYLIFVGDIEPAAAKALAEKSFGNWKKGVFTKQNFAKPVQPKQTYVAIVDRPASVQSVVAIAGAVDLLPGSSNVIAGSVMNNILGGGFSGRLFANLREKYAFTYGAYSSLSPSRQIGIFQAEASVRNEKTDSSIQELLREINSIRNEQVGETELSRMKNYLSGGFARSLENPATIANFALNIARNNLPADYYQKYLTNLAAVDAAKVQNAAKLFLNTDQMHIVIVGNAKQIAKGLDKYGPIKYFDIEGNEVAAPTEVKADASLTPAALMEKAIAAIGSKEALSSIKDVQLKGTANLMGQSLEMQQTIVMPGNSVTTMSMGGMAMMRQAVVDGKYSVAQQGQEAPITDDLKEGLDESATLVPEELFLTKGYGLKIVGAEKVDGKDAIDVEVTTPSKKVSHRFYDAKTFLLVKTSKSEEVPGRGTATQQQYFTGYKTVNGVQISTEQLMDLGQMKINIKYTDIKVNQGLKSSDLK
ncbi:MAG: insulinase family protein [Chitinophagaceae bacterium]|nr:insulinase family protein [Chitinophagaceae bacterium]MCF8288815.1 insulinase family protein [Chitinophagaceae bacterium]MCF8421626.1 insulinase family protein [Chitinophagaceae bacterium]